MKQSGHPFYKGNSPKKQTTISPSAKENMNPPGTTSKVTKPPLFSFGPKTPAPKAATTEKEDTKDDPSSIIAAMREHRTRTPSAKGRAYAEERQEAKKKASTKKSTGKKGSK